METTKSESVRRAFIERENRPTYAELAQEFQIPVGTIGCWAADQSWPAMRSAHLDAQLVKCDAQSVLLEAVRTDRSLLAKFTSVAIAGLEKLAMVIESVSPERAAQTNAGALNTASFAYVNFARGLHEAGILGISKVVGTGKEANGRWNPEMLQQINVTVQNLQAQAEAKPAPTKPPVEMD